MLKEFRQFVLRGNVIDLAIGVVIGAAFSLVVNAIVNGLLNPLIGFVGTGDLAKMKVCVGSAIDPSTKSECLHAFHYGQVISAIIQFLLIAAAIFFFVVKPVNHLMDRFETAEPEGEPTRECPECLSKIPRAARRCAYCTAQVGVA
jgi:large conductance mechanosensitive channel